MKRQNCSYYPSVKDTLFKGSLIALTVMIFLMALIGGLTRLTGSGLSIVEWKPLTGILPPLTSQEWALEFAKYQQSPEFQKINLGMTLADFQSIFWLEYIHRLWGRLLAILLLIPTYLTLVKAQHRELWPFLSLLWILGGAQGVMGWMMVKSGLVHDPHVSPYRLAMHLWLGFAVFGVSLWMTLKLYKNDLLLERKGFSQKAYSSLTKITFLAILLMVITACFGAFVAGLKAGFLYNSFPLMGEAFIPHEIFSLSPWWKDILENPVTVQFLHRMLAIITLGFCCWLWVYQRKLEIPPLLSRAYSWIIILVFLQFSLGILTLLLVIPIGIATLHQGVAFVLFGSLLYTIFLLSNREKH
jgi:cytochrome c oxidase assembly protein subunit 15